MRGLITVIAYNEEKNLPMVLKELKDFVATQKNLEIHLAVIDNASSDQTPEVVESIGGVTLVRHCINNGGSMGTVLSYFRLAHKMDVDFLIQFDGDGQHIASEIPHILGPLLANEADYVIGSRYLDKQGFQSTFLRRIGIKTFNSLIHSLTGEKITDSTSGFRAYSKKVIRIFSNKFPHEVIDPMQLLVISSFAGMRIREVPTEMRARIHGKSEFQFFSSLKFVFAGLLTLGSCYLQKPVLKKL